MLQYLQLARASDGVAVFLQQLIIIDMNHRFVMYQNMSCAATFPNLFDRFYIISNAAVCFLLRPFVLGPGMKTR
jgi:hypothetical protein